MSITLHSKLGVNPRLVMCSQCGKETISLAMLGIRNYKLICSCGAIEYGGENNKPCPKCHIASTRERKELTDVEPIYTGEICEKCITLNKQTNTEVISNGGIYFECKKCHSKGAVKRNEYCIEVRKELSIKHNKNFNDPTDNKYLPVGILVDECPICSSNDSVSDSADNRD